MPINEQYLDFMAELAITYELFEETKEYTPSRLQRMISTQQGKIACSLAGSGMLLSMDEELLHEAVEGIEKRVKAYRSEYAGRESSS